MGKQNDIRKSLKKRRQHTQKQLGGQQLHWTPCAYVLGYPQGFKAQITQEQSRKAGQ